MHEAECKCYVCVLGYEVGAGLAVELIEDRRRELIAQGYADWCYLDGDVIS